MASRSLRTGTSISQTPATIGFAVSAATGVIHTVAGTGESGPSDADDAVLGDGGPAKQARLSMPMDVAIGPEGDIYVADMGTPSGAGDRRGYRDHHDDRGRWRPSLGGRWRAGSRCCPRRPCGLALSWSKGQVTVFVAEHLGGNVRAITRGGDISTVGAPGRFSAHHASPIAAEDGSTSWTTRAR